MQFSPLAAMDKPGSKLNDDDEMYVLFCLSENNFLQTTGTCWLNDRKVTQQQYLNWHEEYLRTVWTFLEQLIFVLFT